MTTDTAFQNCPVTVSTVLAAHRAIHRDPEEIEGLGRLFESYRQLGPPYILTALAVEDIGRILDRLTVDVAELVEGKVLR